ncbi:MAG: TRAP transporter small permease subunit [Azospirillaceae bacterium]
MRRLLSVLQRAADLVGAALFAALFGAFVLQIFMRYVVREPLGWTLEACMIAYVWMVFWAAAFMTRERDHVAFTMIYDGVAPPVRRILALLSALVLGAAFFAALPATYDFISFMALDKTWILKIRFDYVYGVFLAFLIAVAVRQVLRVFDLARPGWHDRL